MAEDITLSELTLVTKDGDPVSLVGLLVAAGVNLGNTLAGDLAERPDAADVVLGTIYYALDEGTQYRRNEDPDWELVASSGASGAPTGTAGGDLTGTYPAPTIADGAVDLATVAAAIKDAAAGTASLRTLGTSATSAAAGNDSRLSNARTPTGAAGGVLAGTFPNPSFASPMYTRAEVDQLIALLATAQSVVEALEDHLAALDPHTGYVLESTLGVSVPTLVGGRVPVTQLGTGTAAATKVLAGDGSWQTLEALLAQTPGIVTTEMLDFDVAQSVADAITTHNDLETAHDAAAFVALQTEQDGTYQRLGGRSIFLRTSATGDPSAEMVDFDILGDGSGA